MPETSSNVSLWVTLQMTPQMTLQSQKSAKLGIKRGMPETSSKHPSKGIQIAFLQRSAAIRDICRRVNPHGTTFYQPPPSFGWRAARMAATGLSSAHRYNSKEAEEPKGISNSRCSGSLSSAHTLSAPETRGTGLLTMLPTNFANNSILS